MSQQIRRLESVFSGADGLALLHRAWVAEHADRQMFLVHGFGEHSARYDAMGAWFASRGWAVHAYDHRGHGRSGGPRNFVKHFDDYVADLGIFVDQFASNAAGTSRVLIGHSMGGLVVARALVQGDVAVDASVLSGAALEIPRDLPRSKQMAAVLLSRILPKLRIHPGFTAEDLSRDPEVARRYEADPLVDTGMTLGLAAAMFVAQRETGGQGPQVRVPLLGLHGAEDPICPAAGTERFLAEVETPQSGCTVYPELRHEIFNEPEREQVWQDILDFVDRVEKRAGSAASRPL